MTKNNLKSKLTGYAVNDSHDKTCKIEIELSKVHPLYMRRFKSKRHFLVHTDKEIKKGQKVEIVPTRKVSRRKSWKVLE